MNTTPSLVAGELAPPELVAVNSRELRSALTKYPSPDLAAAFSNELGCGDLYFSQVVLETTPQRPA